MKQIYNFEQFQPPVLTQVQLTQKATQRRFQHQTALLAIASLSIFLCLFLCMVLLIPESITLSLLCACYLIISATGGSVLIIIFTQKRRNLVWQM